MTRHSELPTSDERIEERRRQILSAAYEVFARKGYHGASIADIAAELGLGHGTFYRYFRNKLDIFAQVVEDVIERLGEVVRAEDPTATDTLEEYRAQIERIGKRLLELLMREESLARLLFYEVLGIDAWLDERVQEAMELFGRMTERYLVNGRDKGFLRADLDATANVGDVRDIARGHLLAAERGGLGECYLLGGGDVSMERLARVALATAGLRRPVWRVPDPLLRAAGAGLLWASRRITGRPPLLTPAAVAALRLGLRADCSRARRELGFRCRPLEESVRDALRWFVEHGHVRSRRARRALAGPDAATDPARGSEGIAASGPGRVPGSREG